MDISSYLLRLLTASLILSFWRLKDAQPLQGVRKPMYLTAASPLQCTFIWQTHAAVYFCKKGKRCLFTYIFTYTHDIFTYTHAHLHMHNYPQKHYSMILNFLSSLYLIKTACSYQGRQHWLVTETGYWADKTWNILLSINHDHSNRGHLEKVDKFSTPLGKREESPSGGGGLACWKGIALTHLFSQQELPPALLNTAPQEGLIVIAHSP